MGQTSYFKNLLTMYRYDHPVSGEIKELTVVIVDTGWGKLSLQVQFAKFWNALPSSLRFLPSLSRFKKLYANNSSIWMHYP